MYICYTIFQIHHVFYSSVLSYNRSPFSWENGISIAPVRVAIKKIDKAAAKGIIKKNTAARRKSSLARKLNAGA
jgi:ribosomal protein S20